MAQHRLKFNGLILQKVYSIHDGSGEIGQVQAKNVHEALALGKEEFGEEARCAFLLPERKETRFSK